MQIPQRFLDAFEQQESCWIWLGSPSSSGYGQCLYKEKHWSAHRLSYTLYRGEIPKGKLVCHTCDNKLCVNPEHLYVGTHKDNNRDTYARNRMPLRYGHLAINVAKLSEEAAREIKYSNIETKTLCQKHQVNQSQISRIRNGKTWKNI